MDVEIEQPHRHHPTGHYWLDRLLPLSAVVISIVSIGIAFHHGKVMEALVQQNERLVQANSLPHLELSGSNRDDQGNPVVTFDVANKGVGPAEIRSVQILVDNKPVRHASELLRACCEDDGSHVTTSTLYGTMLQAGQRVHYLRTPVGDPKSVGARLHRARMESRIVTNICYCSVFDECWIRSSGVHLRPQRVRFCPMPQPQYRS